jgi:hypothetical protein
MRSNPKLERVYMRFIFMLQKSTLIEERAEQKKKNVIKETFDSYLMGGKVCELFSPPDG